MWEPSQRYPDPAVQVIDASFNRYRLPLASVERLFTGCRWSEGPVYFGDGRYVLWSDIPNDRILKWEEETGAVSVYRKSSNNANGNTRDRQGRLVTCEHRGRRVIRTEYDGAITVLADSFQGKRLNSPNDVVVKSDGSIWFTDPPFGLLGYYEGERHEPELPANVYRVDGQTGAITVVADDVQGPNGLAFSPDEIEALRGGIARACRRASCACSTSTAARWAPAGCSSTRDRARRTGSASISTAICGAAGAWARQDLDGVRIFNPAGEPIGHIALPERCANLCFGGRWRNRLFMAASHGLYALYVNTQGALGRRERSACSACASTAHRSAPRYSPAAPRI